MEYTDYFVAKGTVEAVKAKIEAKHPKGLILDDTAPYFPFVVEENPENIEKNWDWLLRVWDAESSAWGFDLYQSGKKVMTATFGENGEWGIGMEDNGYEGDVEEAARLLGIKKEDLEECLNEEGAYDFCNRVGFDHAYCFYPHEDDMPDGVVLMSELVGDDDDDEDYDDGYDDDDDEYDDDDM
jgi:hypothetical protein